MTAEQMFKELGYKVEFNEEEQKIEIICRRGFVWYEFDLKHHSLENNVFESIELDDLKAIFQLAKEIGWLDD